MMYEVTIRKHDTAISMFMPTTPYLGCPCTLPYAPEVVCMLSRHVVRTAVELIESILHAVSYTSSDPSLELLLVIPPELSSFYVGWTLIVR